MGVAQSRPYSYWDSLWGPSYGHSSWGTSYNRDYDYDRHRTTMYTQAPSSFTSPTSTGILGSTGSSNAFSGSMGSSDAFSGSMGSSDAFSGSMGSSDALSGSMGSSNSSSATTSIPVGGRKRKNTRKAKKVNRKNTRKNRN